MSQSGKVLHLYVEVRSAPGQTGGKEERVSQGHSAQDSQAELLSGLASQTTSQAATKTSAVHHLLQSPSATLKFQQTGRSISPSLTKRWSAPCDQGCSLSSGKVSLLQTPVKCQEFAKEEACESMRSVVTFGYIEKPNVKTVKSPLNSSCKRGTREERSTSCQFRKRLSDPVWLGSPDSSCSSSPKLTFSSPGTHQQPFSPGLRQPPIDPIGRAATQRAVEEFGSPLLRIKLAHALEHNSHYNLQPRCQSWAGSPVQRQNNTGSKNIADRIQAICGLPRSQVKDQYSPQFRQHGRPQSSVESQGLVQCPDKKKYANRSNSAQGSILQFGNNLIEGLNQLSDTKPSAPAQTPEDVCRKAEEATKVSSIFTEAKRSLLHNSLGEAVGASNYEDAQHSKQIVKMNIPLNEQNTPAPENTVSHQPKSSTTQSQETSSQSREEGGQSPPHQSGALSASQNSPAIPSRVIRPAYPPSNLSSPMRDPRQFQAEFRAPDTPTLHRHQFLPYAREPISLSQDKSGDLSCFEIGNCTEPDRSLPLSRSVEETPVSWMSRQQWGNLMEEGPRPSPDSGFGNGIDQTSDQRSNVRQLSPTSQHKRAEQRRREILLLGPVVLDSPEEDEGCDDGERGPKGINKPPEQNGTMRGGSSSRSSSGVTGSLGDCVSPESSQSSHHSNETGVASSGIQVGFNCTIFTHASSLKLGSNVYLHLPRQMDSGCAAPTPSLHCQRIARAKWEFLFGTPAEDGASRGEKGESTSHQVYLLTARLLYIRVDLKEKL